MRVRSLVVAALLIVVVSISNGPVANGQSAWRAAAKNAAVLAPGELSGFLSRKIQNIRGAAPAACPEGGLDNIVDVPLAAPCTASLRPGGSRTARRGGSGSSGVRIAA